MSIKALTLWQPWATLVAMGAKRIETRSWKTEYRGPLAIHAGLKLPGVVDELVKTEPFRTCLAEYQKMRGNVLVGGLPRGCIVAVCKLLCVVPITKAYVEAQSLRERAFGDYTAGRYAWFLGSVTRLDPPVYGVRGHQRLWTWRYDQVIGERKDELITLVDELQQWFDG